MSIFWLLLCLLAYGCQESSSPSSSELDVEENEQGILKVQARIHPDLPEFSFTLVGPPVDGTTKKILARKIVIRNSPIPQPMQVIEDLEIEVSVIDSSKDFEVVDMNFDGYGDIRIVEFRPPGPNVPYLNWLFDPHTRKFIRSPELNEISSPIFDAEAKRIRSEWRDGPTRYGTNIYEIIESKPVLTRKELRVYSEPGIYELTIMQNRDGHWYVLEQEHIREKN